MSASQPTDALLVESTDSSKREPASEDQLDEPPVAGIGQREAISEIHFPIRAGVEICHNVKLMLLFRSGIKSTDRTEHAVIFGPDVDLSRRVERNGDIRRKFNASRAALQRRIE